MDTDFELWLDATGTPADTDEEQAAAYAQYVAARDEQEREWADALAESRRDEAILWVLEDMRYGD